MADPVAVDALFGELLQTEDDALRAARESAAAESMPAIEVSAQHGRLLELLTRIARARRVLEIGTLAGYSTICLARGVGPDGQVVTLEFDPRHAEVARKNLDRAGVADRVEVIVGAALDTLPTLAGPFDLFFIDADKENNTAYVEWGRATRHAGCGDRRRQRHQDGPGAGPGTRGHPGARGARHAGHDGQASPAGHRRDPDRRHQGLGRLRGRSGGLAVVT